MDRITQIVYWRQRGIKYARPHGGTAAAIRKRYHGTAESLKDRPPAQRHSPRAQSPEERALVRRYAKKYPDDLPPGYEKPRPYGYAGSYGGFRRRARKLRETPVKPWGKRKNKPYRPAHYPGQKIQMDMKFAPPYCAADGNITNTPPRTNAPAGPTGRCTASAAPSAPGTFRKSSLGQRDGMDQRAAGRPVPA